MNAAYPYANDAGGTDAAFTTTGNSENTRSNHDVSKSGNSWMAVKIYFPSRMSFFRVTKWIERTEVGDFRVPRCFERGKLYPSPRWFYVRHVEP